VAVRLQSMAAGKVFWGGSGVTPTPTNAGGFIDAGEAVTFDITTRYGGTDSIYFCGTAGDRAHFTLIS